MQDLVTSSPTVYCSTPCRWHARYAPYAPLRGNEPDITAKVHNDAATYIAFKAADKHAERHHDVYAGNILTIPYLGGIGETVQALDSAFG